jgi:hypothetical protein
VGSDDAVRIIQARPADSAVTRQLDGLMGEWSFAEMKRQRETFFKQEVDIEQQMERRRSQSERLLCHSILTNQITGSLSGIFPTHMHTLVQHALFLMRENRTRTRVLSGCSISNS